MKVSRAAAAAFEAFEAAALRLRLLLLLRGRGFSRHQK